MREKYMRAEQLLTENTIDAVLNGDMHVTWMGDDAFWYIHEQRKESTIQKTLTIVSTETGEKKYVCDMNTLLRQFEEFDQEMDFQKIKQLTVSSEEKSVQFTYQNSTYLYEINEEKLTQLQKSKRPRISEDVSPNGKYAAFVQDYNMFVKNIDTGEVTPLTTDGTLHNDYGAHPQSNNIAVTQQLSGEDLPPGIMWSPQSNKLLTYKLNQEHVEELHVIQSVRDKDEPIRPRLFTYRYPFAGECVPEAQLYICDIEANTCEQVPVDPLYINFTPPFTADYQKVLWSEDGKHIFVTWLSRDFTRAEGILVDTETMETSTIVTEKSDTFLFLDSFGEIDGNGLYAFNHGFLSKTNEIIWHSERSGWSHLYVYDLKTKKCIRALTEGDWMVKSIVRIDEQNDWIYFLGSHRDSQINPYYNFLYRIRPDGSALTLLTPEDADHLVTLSPGSAFFVDTYSRVDAPPVTVLRSIDGAYIDTIERADIEELLERGYQIPERIKVQSKDGQWDLHGLLIHPTEVVDGKKYPVIDYAYGGPQTVQTPKRFTWKNDYFDPLGRLQSFAQLGFVGVMMDGPGSSQREKAFHDVSYQHLQGSCGLDDHVHVIEKLALDYSFMDLERVGIWGASGGGYATARGMLEHPDFYKVGISIAGNHDSRLYNATWVERYNGLYNQEVYEKQDNTALAGQLKGELLIIHGDLDENVHISQSIRLIDALVKENKDFEFLLMPNEHHIVQSHPYVTRKMWDFFVTHLLKETPPKGFVIHT